MVKVLTGADGYCLEVGEEQSEIVAYGEPLDVELGGTRYLAFVDEEENGDAVSLLPDLVYKVGAGECAAEFGDLDEEDDEEEAAGAVVEEDDDDDEEEVPK